jgi:hypothetical protein
MNEWLFKGAADLPPGANPTRSLSKNDSPDPASLRSNLTVQSQPSHAQGSDPFWSLHFPRSCAS